MKLRNILLSCVLVIGSMSLLGCYTQLAALHSLKPETEETEWGYDRYTSYSLGTYYSDRLFYSYYGYGSPFGYRDRYSNMYGWNYYTSPYYRSYNPYYDYRIVPKTGLATTEKSKRTWERNPTSNNSNLLLRRSNNTSVGSSSASNTGGSKSSSSSSSNSGARVTRRNN